MALERTYANGVWTLKGITAGGGSLDMGRMLYPVGDHWVGFDDGFAQPVVVKAVYAPDTLPREAQGAELVGYMQLMQLTFQGVPVPPSVYGGSLAERMPYVTGEELRFVDFMEPALAFQSMPAGERDGDPFYPFNGLLRPNAWLRQPSSFARHPLPNGSLFFPSMKGPGDTRVASLVAEVPAGLKTEQAIAAMLDPATVVARFAPPPEKLAASEAYRLAFDWLAERGLLPELELAECAGEVVGRYVLLTLPDPENESAVLCIYTEQSGGKTFVVAHALSDDEVDPLDADASAAILLRTYEDLRSRGWVDSTAMEATVEGAPARGRGGLMASPFGELGPYPFALNYTTMAFARGHHGFRAGHTHPLSGFRWSVLFSYDEDTRLLAPTAVRKPEPAPAESFAAEIAQYHKARSKPSMPDETVDTSVFTRAAMYRDNLAAGAKLRFVDYLGADVEEPPTPMEAG